MGIACLRTSDYSVELSAFCDDQSYSKTLSVLTRHEPRTILFPPAMQDTVLAKIAMTEFPQASFSIVPRRAWNEMKGGLRDGCWYGGSTCGAGCMARRGRAWWACARPAADARARARLASTRVSRRFA